MKSTAIIFGFNYHNSRDKSELSGVLRDIYLAINWSIQKGFNVHLCTDYAIKRMDNVSEFKIENDLLPNNIVTDLNTSDNVFFFYTGHGKNGNFIIGDKSINMTDLLYQVESSTNAKILSILDCCEVIIDLPPNYKNIIFAGSDKDSKAYCEAYSGLLTKCIFEIFSSRKSRDCLLVLNQLKRQLPREMVCQLITKRKYIHGWVLPGLNFDIDEQTNQLYIYKNYNKYLLLTGQNAAIYKLIMAKIKNS